MVEFIQWMIFFLPIRLLYDEFKPRLWLRLLAFIRLSVGPKTGRAFCWHLSILLG